VRVVRLVAECAEHLSPSLKGQRGGRGPGRHGEAAAAMDLLMGQRVVEQAEVSLGLAERAPGAMWPRLASALAPG